MASLEKKLLLIDCDCGTDDAQAIMMALAAPNVEVLGITCVEGNTSLDNVCKNVLRVLKVCKRLDIPVYRGLQSSVLGEHLHASQYHGEDGLGNVPDPDAPGLDLLKNEHAVHAMIKLATKYNNQISLVAIGPLSNLAMAVRMDPTFPNKLKSLYIMGGNMESRGNTTACGEFNFVADPEGAYIVLNSFQCPTYIATWEYTCLFKLPWEWYDQWVNKGTEKADFVKKTSAYSLQFSRYNKEVKELIGEPGYVPCDSFAVAAAIDESSITSYIECPVTVETDGKFTRGMMVLDTIDYLKKQTKAFVINGCDLEKFKMLLEASVK
nr:pyrimidine-specific ribonucleoside hydrolase RihA-like isoform X2 [Geotrypetes seraphini]XP_033785602.1 pyrimidine-specific ribonucleoside hydrolase RihA-like isoform X2 [Geotrypetes seraphini]XP_033785603.1 pyrimidine-specific ribonucleoside hydrolase RihA-like isoform X2 [Geotrypetes seraphini]XP_033785605.1 pyrimidine-specific ribonucleoside hydrolase RihA-like isoform X2 [Geotrypetes seraphini]XP_033785606.1 pyrimidine-specific ribonucleoside hydrolase RihA-like isoform X2 [Geotrypetes s